MVPVHVVVDICLEESILSWCTSFPESVVKNSYNCSVVGPPGFVSLKDILVDEE